MTAAALVIWTIVVVLALTVLRRQGSEGLFAAGGTAVQQGKALMIRLPLALLAAAFLMQVLPVALLVSVIGPQSGLAGILLATIVGQGRRGLAGHLRGPNPPTGRRRALSQGVIQVVRSANFTGFRTS